MPRRRRSRFASPAPRAGSPFLTGTPRSRARRPPRRHSGPGLGGIARIVAVLAFLGAIGAGILVWRSHEDAIAARREAASRFLGAWAQRDSAGMWKELTAD